MECEFLVGVPLYKATLVLPYLRVQPCQVTAFFCLELQQNSAFRLSQHLCPSIKKIFFQSYKTIGTVSRIAFLLPLTLR